MLILILLIKIQIVIILFSLPLCCVVSKNINLLIVNYLNQDILFKWKIIYLVRNFHTQEDM